ncbi:hypothetical protein ACSVDA_15520 [Cytobacillus sp. Hm23]
MYAHYALHRFNMSPKEFEGLERREKAFVIASIKVQIEKEKEEMDKLKGR